MLIFFSCGIIFWVYENFKLSITGTFKHTLYYFLQLYINLFINNNKIWYKIIQTYDYKNVEYLKQRKNFKFGK